jgi:hypothetical protein
VDSEFFFTVRRGGVPSVEERFVETLTSCPSLLASRAQADGQERCLDRCSRISHAEWKASRGRSDSVAPRCPANYHNWQSPGGGTGFLSRRFSIFSLGDGHRRKLSKVPVVIENSVQ